MKKINEKSSPVARRFLLNIFGLIRLEFTGMKLTEILIIMSASLLFFFLILAVVAVSAR